MKKAKYQRMATLNQICNVWKEKCRFHNGDKPRQCKWNVYLFSKLKFLMTTAREELLTGLDTLRVFPQVRL